MKKSFYAILTLVFLLIFTGCSTARGPAADDTDTEVTESESDDSRDDESEDDEDVLKSITYELRRAETPEIVEVIFSGYCDGEMETHASITNLYGIDVTFTGVVGRVGPPIEITYNRVEDPVLSFVYDPDELRGMPESNFLVLFESTDNPSPFFKAIDDFEVDYENNTVTISAKKVGVYILVDAYQWFTVWGVDASKYAYDIDVQSYVSDWERSSDTGSIMNLADKQWAVDNAPEFHVFNAEELASVVYYVNAFSDGSEEYSVYIEDDIDLEGYDWKPMGWSDMGNNHCFTGLVDGKGHTINGMHIEVGYVEAGFIGYGLTVQMKDIAFTNAYVSSTRSAGITGGEVFGTVAWNNVSVQGELDTTVGKCGAIIGLSSGPALIDCSADVKANGEHYNYFTYDDMLKSTMKVVETFTLTLNDDYSISRDDFEGFDNLGWHIELNGVQVLDRSAVDFYTGEPELLLAADLQWLKGREGVHTIYLTAYQNGAYVRVSNIITYEL